MGRLTTMRKLVLAIGCVCFLAACSSAQSAESTKGDIAKVVEVKSSFGPDFHVKTIDRTGIDPRVFATRKLPSGLKFDPAGCSKFAVGQTVPPGVDGNMAAVAAEGNGNRFIAIAVETSKPLPFSQPGRRCQKVGFTGGDVRGVIEVVDVPQIEGTRTLGVHRVLQKIIDGHPHTGELYDYSAHFGDYQVIVTANPLVLPNKPVAPVDTARARGLLVKAVDAVRS